MHGKNQDLHCIAHCKYIIQVNFSHHIAIRDDGIMTHVSMWLMDIADHTKTTQKQTEKEVKGRISEQINLYSLSMRYLSMLITPTGPC
jgi:hypothetical protein